MLCGYLDIFSRFSIQTVKGAEGAITTPLRNPNKPRQPGCQIPKPHLAHAALKIGDVDFVDSGVLGEIDLSPATFFPQCADPQPNLDADVG